MNAQATVRVTEARTERRVYRRPWGVEIQLWTLAETITIPETAASMSISSLLVPSRSEEGAACQPGSDDDDRTLDNLELNFEGSR